MNAKSFHEQMAIGLFRQVYPMLAARIIRKSGIRRGICVDVGGGSGVLATELAKQSELNVFVVDKDEACKELASEYIAGHDLSERIRVVTASAEWLPFPDFSIDLVVSRGSVFFWTDKVKGINEIYRILRPGGFAFVGGGMGSTQLKRKILAAQSISSNWGAVSKQRYRQNLPIHLKLMMRETRVPDWEMESSDEGTWILFRKNKNQKLNEYE